MTNEKRAPYNYNRVTSLGGPKDHLRNPDFTRMERIQTYTFIAPNPKFSATDKSEYAPKRYSQPIAVYVYSKGSKVYARFYASDKFGEKSFYGIGLVGGGGYDKISAAIDDAVDSAGIIMEKSFAGCGGTPTCIALEAIAKRLGWKTGQVIKV